MDLLDIRSVTKVFGGLTALNEVSFRVRSGNIHGLIGPNGAGKSTMFKNISGFSTPTSGDIFFNGHSIKGRKPWEIAHLGVVRTFQETTLFQELTVLENALVGAHKRAKTNLFSAIFNLDRPVQEACMEKTLDVLDFMGLTKRKNQLASELPLGSQRALAITIALVSEPVVLLMDEPFAGMNPEETRHMMELTEKVRQSGVTIVLVEHDMKAVMGICDRLTVLNFGSLLAEGTPDTIRHDDRVIRAYLGNAEAL